MKIVSVEWSEEVKSLLKEIFSGEDLPHFFEGSTDDYLLHLLRYMAGKCKADASREFRDEMWRLAANAHNAIHYSIQLGSDRHPIDD